VEKNMVVVFTSHFEPTNIFIPKLLLDQFIIPAAKLTCAYPTMNAARKYEHNSFYNILKTARVGVR